MKNWFRFLKSLETEGGSIVVLLALVLLFSYFVKAEFKDAESQLYFILGALVGLLKGNNDRAQDETKAKTQPEKNADADKVT